MNLSAFLILQLALFIVSFGAVCSKMAGKYAPLSLYFCLFYGLLIVILFVYAIVWQQVLKRIPLIVAYACKGIGVIYAILWGVIFFNEKIKWNMIAGAVLVLIGVYIFIWGELKEEKAKEKAEAKQETEAQEASADD